MKTNSIKKKVSELIGSQLDYAVAMACSEEYRPNTEYNGIGMEFEAHAFSTDWSQGGPIIERENISLDAPYLSTKSWFAYKMEVGAEGLPCWGNIGPTPLIAAMRCFVESKLDDEIEIPDHVIDNMNIVLI